MSETGKCTWCGEDPFYVAYHDDEWGRPETEADLVQRRFISFSPDAPQPEASRVWVGSKFTSERRSHVTMNSYFGVLKAAIAGLGIAEVE